MTSADVLRRLGRDEAVGVQASPVTPTRVLARAHRKLSARRAVVFVEVAAVAVVLTAGGFAARALVQGRPEGPPDTLAPPRPRGLVAEAPAPDEVHLSWRPARDETGVSYYTVYRDGEDVDTAVGTTYTDTSVAPATTYKYAVVAVDKAGNRSERSKPAAVTTPQGEDTPPSVPTKLEAEAVEPMQVDLSWSASEDDGAVLAYTVFRDGEEVETVEGTTYSDTDVEPKTTYQQRGQP